MKMPDFEEWSKNIIITHENRLRPEIEIPGSMPLYLDIRTALKQAFEQGYQLGLNQGWAIEQDKEYAKKDCEAKS
jgi:hypothetical protein